MTIQKLGELNGLTPEAIRAYIKKGKLRVRVHWIKGQNGRTMIHVRRFEQWLAGIEE